MFRERKNAGHKAICSTDSIRYALGTPRDPYQCRHAIQSQTTLADSVKPFWFKS